jgi:hypothetical protein
MENYAETYKALRNGRVQKNTYTSLPQMRKEARHQPRAYKK